MVKDIDIKVKWAYIRFKEKLALSFTLYFIALLLGISLILSSEFVYNNYLLKVWSVVLLILLFIKVAYDAGVNMKRQYSDFTKLQMKGQKPI